MKNDKISKLFSNPENMIINSILEILSRYSNHTALTNTEEESTFLAFLKEDFEIYYFDYDVKESYYNNKLEYVFCRSKHVNQFTSQFFFTVHVDRVACTEPKINNISSKITGAGDTIIQGQLDNIISIAILRHLSNMGFHFNVLFTTKEEIFKSISQVIEVTRAESLIPISLDIDVFETLSQFEDGQITLRDEDINAKFHVPTVQTLRKIANSIDVPYFINEGYTSVETGFMAKRTGGKVLGAHIGIPIINYHTNKERTSEKCVLNMIKLLERILS